MEYYYLSSYLVAPSFSFLLSTIEDTIIIQKSQVNTNSLWVGCALIAYCLVALLICYFVLLYAKTQDLHYSSFYSILPLVMRENNQELKEYVKQIMKITD